ncbi:DUF397 domain-containing protein [Streptomyces sp. cg35]|uniref:DUF397 domain-containing protein n=1 Tax=Streptomyces sp. cg35 TaxID=3421650 RepID=UPI003D184D37
MTEPIRWQRSTFSGGGDGNTCVEVATIDGSIHLRESDDPGTEMATTPTALFHLLSALKTNRR